MASSSNSEPQCLIAITRWRAVTKAVADRSRRADPARPEKFQVQSDSQLLVRQLNGEYRVKDAKLKVLYQHALTLLRQFDSYRILHVYREMNKVADRLANRGIDEASRR